MAGSAMVREQKRAAELVDRALTGPITRVRVSPLYLGGLLFVAVAVALLPLTYIGLIGLTGFAVYEHAVHNAGVLSGGTHGVYGRRAAVGILAVKAIAYIGPIVIGAVLLVFMLKPLFARRVSRERRLTLVPSNEPVLFAFVYRLCACIGAPQPRRIDVDCDMIY
jgi:hypothetical protein